MFFYLILLLMGQIAFAGFVGVALMALFPPLRKWMTRILVLTATTTWIFPFIYLPTLYLVYFIPLSPQQRGLLHFIPSLGLTIWLARKNPNGLQTLLVSVIHPAQKYSRSLIDAPVWRAMGEVTLKLWRSDVAPFLRRHAAAIVLATLGVVVMGLFGLMALQAHRADLVTPDGTYREAIDAYAHRPKIDPWSTTTPTPKAPVRIPITLYVISILADAVILIFNLIGLWFGVRHLTKDPYTAHPVENRK